jgi:hypothetical protein
MQLSSSIAHQKGMTFDILTKGVHKDKFETLSRWVHLKQKRSTSSMSENVEITMDCQAYLNKAYPKISLFSWKITYKLLLVASS